MIRILGLLFCSMAAFSNMSFAESLTVKILKTSCSKYSAEMRSYHPVGCFLSTTGTEKVGKWYFHTGVDNVGSDNPAASYNPGTGYIIPMFSVYEEGQSKFRFFPSISKERDAFYGLVENAKAFEANGEKNCIFNLTFDDKSGEIQDSKLSCN